jgi:hypothetical protein
MATDTDLKPGVEQDLGQSWRIPGLWCLFAVAMAFSGASIYATKVEPNQINEEFLKIQESKETKVRRVFDR